MQAKQSYENDGTLKMLSDLLEDDESFIDIMQSAQVQKLSYLQEKLRKIMHEHQQLVLIILRLKKILFVSGIWGL